MSGDGQESWDEGPGTPSCASSPVGSQTGSEAGGDEDIMSEFRCVVRPSLYYINVRVYILYRYVDKHVQFPQ